MTTSRTYQRLSEEKKIFRCLEMDADGKFDSDNVTVEMVIAASNIIHSLNRLGILYYTVILYQEMFETRKRFSKYELIVTTTLN